jgi:molybdopterin converting factor small subunit
MIIHLRIFGSLKDYLGDASPDAELPEGATVRDLLNLIESRWGNTLPPELWDAETKRFRAPVLMISQGTDLHDLGIRLSDQQEIFLLMPLAGG